MSTEATNKTAHNVPIPSLEITAQTQSPCPNRTRLHQKTFVAEEVTLN